MAQRPASNQAMGYIPLAMAALEARSNSRVLIVDDDVEMREALGAFLSDHGHDCELAADGPTALKVVERVSVDAVLCDMRMDGMNGLEVLDRVKRTHPALPFVVITGMGEIREAVAAIKRGAFHYVTKPCDPDELRALIASAIEERRRRESTDGTVCARALLSTTTGELVGDGLALRSLHECIHQVAASNAPVIITGETGVGKELVARAIHARGARHGKPFVAVNTSAIPQDLLEGEVFGHVRGAFTGASHARAGLLTDADGGTLLLDEIGDMPIGLQAKLLRVLQFGDVRPVGGDRTHHVNVRVIAATHRDLPGLVREGRFRDDLYYRLNVLPVFVPALRDHPEDIPALVAHFLNRARQRAPHSVVRSIDPEALATLTAAPWPGNVRELESTVERLVVFCAKEVVTRQELARVQSPAPTSPSSFPSQGTPTLRRLSRAYTDWVLVQTGGNKERAAEILGIDLSTLYRRQRVRHI